MNIPGVPGTITRAAYLELIESFGINPYDVIWIRLDSSGVTAEVKARDHEGKTFEAGPNELAKHIVRIKVIDR